MSLWHLAVLIPAHNEQELLPRCLRSVQAACLRLPPTITSDIVIAIDDSWDASDIISRQALGSSGCVVQLRARCVGQARRVAACAALARYTGEPETCWLANTDADCEVPEDWLLQHLDAARRGVTAIAGIVDVDSFTEHAGHVERRFRETYLIHPDGTHPHVHGANLGVRADAYLAAGGWRDVRTAEDSDLWSRLRANGGALLSDARLTVLTSGRRTGHAPDGFADALAAHNSWVPA